MNKPYTSQEVAFQLYMHNYDIDRIIYITDTNEEIINEWIKEGNWAQLKEDLDKTPYLRDLGRKVDPEQGKHIILDFITYVMSHDAALAYNILKAARAYFATETAFLLPPDPGVQN